MCGCPPASTSGFTRIGRRQDGRPRRDVARRFAQQNFQFGSRFNIEEQNSAAPRAFSGIAQRIANFLARLAHAREHDAIAGNADAAQAVEFAAGNDVEAAAQPRENAQHGKIRIRFHA